MSIIVCATLSDNLLYKLKYTTLFFDKLLLIRDINMLPVAYNNN